MLQGRGCASAENVPHEVLQEWPGNFALGTRRGLKTWALPWLMCASSPFRSITCMTERMVWCRRALSVRHAVEHVADGGRTALPKDGEDLHFEFGRFTHIHWRAYYETVDTMS